MVSQEGGEGGEVPGGTCEVSMDPKGEAGSQGTLEVSMYLKGASR